MSLKARADGVADSKSIDRYDGNRDPRHKQRAANRLGKSVVVLGTRNEQAKAKFGSETEMRA